MSPDATSGGVEVDPLSQASGGIDTSFPLIAPDRVCRFKISSAKKAPVKDAEKAAAGHELLTLQLKTEKSYPDTDGKTLNAGFSVYHRISLTPTEGKDGKSGRTIENIAKDLATLLKAVGMVDKSPRQLLDNPSILEGQVVDCRVGVNKAQGNFPESNSIKFVIPG